MQCHIKTVTIYKLHGYAALSNILWVWLGQAGLLRLFKPFTTYLKRPQLEMLADFMLNDFAEGAKHLKILRYY
jgi:hypothetical protein